MMNVKMKGFDVQKTFIYNFLAFVKNIIFKPFCVTFCLQELTKNLEIPKKQTWAEKEKQSAKYDEERKVNLANKV